MKEFVGVSWGWGEKKCAGLTEGKWLACWNRCFNKHRQVLEERSENFRNFSVVQVLLTGFESSGMLLDGNQDSGFWILGVLWLWRPETAYLSHCLPCRWRWEVWVGGRLHWQGGACFPLGGPVGEFGPCLWAADPAEEMAARRSGKETGEEAQNFSPVNTEIVILMAWKEICPVVVLCLQESSWDGLGNGRLLSPNQRALSSRLFLSGFW